MSLREKLGQPTFGMNVYSGAPAAVEIAGNWGLDFVFIDAEHSVLGLDLPMERMILAARLTGVGGGGGGGAPPARPGGARGGGGGRGRGENPRSDPPPP
ncbi:hypothetical protein Q0601_16060, partial [Paracoccus onubensis]|nr:hypothetical protein [Paracoccus onubensis]